MGASPPATDERTPADLVLGQQRPLAWITPFVGLSAIVLIHMQI